MARYARYDWDLAQQAIDVTASAEASAYGAAQLISELARPARLTAASGNWVLEFDGPVAPAWAVLWNHFLDAGLSNVKLQAHTSDSWGSPAFEATFTIPAKRLDGPSYQRWTRHVLLDLGELPDPGGYAWWRLLIGGTNSQNISIGRLLLLSQFPQVDVFFTGGDIDQGEASKEIDHRTGLDIESGVYPMGGPRRDFTGVVIGTDLDAGTDPIQEAADFRNLHESTEGRMHPFVFLPFEELGEPWLVRWTSPRLGRAHRQDGGQHFPFAVQEIARGLPWP